MLERDSRVGLAVGNLLGEGTGLGLVGIDPVDIDPVEDIALDLVGDIGPAEDIDPEAGTDPAEGTDSEGMLPEADTAAVVDLLEDTVAVVDPTIVVGVEGHHMAAEPAVDTDQGEDIAAGERLGADIHRAVVVDNREAVAAVDDQAGHSQVAGVRRRYSEGAT